MIRFILALLFLASAAEADTIYVSNEELNVIHVIDGATLKETGRIDIGKRPRGLALSPDGRLLYVAVSNDNRISAVERATGKLLGHIPSGPDPETFAVSPDGKHLYIANEDDSLVSVVDIEKRSLISEITVGAEPEGTAVSPDGRLAVQTSESTSMAHVIDTATGKVIDNLLVDTRPRYVAFTPNGKQFWVTSEVRATLTMFDTATRKQLGKVNFQQARLVESAASDVFAQPVGIVFTRDGRRAFVALGRGKLVAEIDPKTFGIVHTFPVGWRAWNLALSPDDKRIYTANGLTGDVSAIDIVANKPLGTVKLGGKPWGIVVAP
ncbi:MAG TPA: PQQ-dependent catabolism-associated beta-propeller protein [Allosphingosinicella sp.]|nr:PQQ-dependent catabolism-associated beta-propeller protein [Allosphingosinicella sp.]